MKAIIFDLDGVLVHTDRFHYLAWKALADKEGIYFDESINHRLRGVSRMDSLAIILERANREYSEDEKIAMADFKNQLYRGYLSKMTKDDVSLEVRKTLDKLKELGFLLAIGSSSKNTRLILEKTDLIGYFDAIADGTMISRSKPDPEVFLLAAKLLYINPSDAYVIEDARAGIDAANAGGFASIAIGEAANYERACYKVSSLEEVLDIVQSSER